MKIHEATEQAYKNGYDKGYEDGRPKWIPVTERLPEDDTRVLVYLRDGYGGNEMIDTDRCRNGRWVRWNKFVSHWAPIPISAPPKGE